MLSKWASARLGLPATLKAALLGAALLGAALIGAPAPARGQDAAAEPPLNPLRALKPSDLGAFREKPLFTPSRQPPRAPQRLPDVPSSAPVVVAAPPRVRLTGIIQGAPAPAAILWRSEASPTATVRLGDEVDGWRVASIDALSILLRSGTREQEYKLFSPSAGPAGAAEAAPTPARQPHYRVNPKVDLGANLRAKPP